LLTIAALPQHNAVSLWLTGSEIPYRPEAKPPKHGGDAASNYYLTAFGKPEAYRTVLRQSR